MSRHPLTQIILSLLLLLGMRAVAHSQDSASDYARIRTPDVGQAVAFMRDVMGCEAIEGAAIDGPRALLACGHGSVVEIVHGAAVGADAAPLRLRADNLQAAMAGLRRQRIRLLRDPATQGSWVVVDVVSPWGQTLELVGRQPAVNQTSGTRLASD